jgi:hypothetical protein
MPFSTAGDAERGEQSVPNVSVDRKLEAVITVWPTLPEAAKAEHAYDPPDVGADIEWARRALQTGRADLRVAMKTR